MVTTPPQCAPGALETHTFCLVTALSVLTCSESVVSNAMAADSSSAVWRTPLTLYAACLSLACLLACPTGWLIAGQLLHRTRQASLAQYCNLGLTCLAGCIEGASVDDKTQPSRSQPGPRSGSPDCCLVARVGS
ncbi:hypothetical protein BCV70DRAFT_112152 [Testicularia cyperi]|uniref:Uncharacterized protein n=1 Tax=Testicularia cyperi TaxID=1882483 RepID=A0A317XQV7_9BASI|nr:hypothetical protein BCV70DRAFT_112152 [Testicularia cyperi]